MGIGDAIGELFIVLGLDSSLDSDFAAAEKSIKGFGGNLSSVGRALSIGVTAPILATGAAIGVLSNEAASFERGMAEVFTLLPGITSAGTAQMTSDVLAFAKETGQLPETVIPALYQALSASVPPENVFSFLQTASQASIGGATDLTTAVDGLTSIVNSYGSDVLDVANASDVMFTTVRLGKTTFEELASSLYHVTPLAAQMGVSFEEIGAALATMTKQGIPTKEATVRLNQALNDLSKEGSKTADAFQEITGTTFPEFIRSGGTLQDALNILQQSAAESGKSIADVFGSVEAGSAALALTGKNADDFASAFEQMQNSTGATAAAFETMDATASRSMDRIKASLSAVSIEIGASFLPIIADTLLPVLQNQLVPILTDKVAPAIASMAGFFAQLPAPIQLAAIALVGLVAAVGPVLLVLGPFVASIGTLIGAAGGLSAALGAVAAPAIAILGPIAAVIAVLALLEYKFGAVSGAINLLLIVLDNFNTVFVSKIPAAIEGVRARIAGLSDTTLLLLGPIGLVIVAWRHWEEILDVLKVVYDGVTQFLGFLVDIHLRAIDFIIDGIERLAAIAGIEIPEIEVRTSAGQALSDMKEFATYMTTDHRKKVEETADLAPVNIPAIEQGTAAEYGLANAVANTNAQLSDRQTVLQVNQSLEDKALEAALAREGSLSYDYRIKVNPDTQITPVKLTPLDLIKPAEDEYDYNIKIKPEAEIDTAATQVVKELDFETKVKPNFTIQPIPPQLLPAPAVNIADIPQQILDAPDVIVREIKPIYVDLTGKIIPIYKPEATQTLPTGGYGPVAPTKQTINIRNDIRTGDINNQGDVGKLTDEIASKQRVSDAGIVSRK